MHEQYTWYFTIFWHMTIRWLHVLPLFIVGLRLLFATCFVIHWGLIDTLRNFLIENCHACLNITKVRIFFQITWTRVYHVYVSMVIVRWLLMYQKIHFIYAYFFTHDKLMVAYKKLTHSLHLLPLFYYNQLLFSMCYFDTLNFFWYLIFFKLKVVHV
jgi:hypothetical protein